MEKGRIGMRLALSRVVRMEDAMDYALSPNGLLVHDREDWPCSVCRPDGIVGRDGYCLCLRCAHLTMAAAGVDVGGAREILDDLADALVALEPQVHLPQSAAN